MIADCSSLDQMFSHYVPQLFASIGSTLVIGGCMFACDWRMALAVLWVVPVAVALTAGSKKIQDAFGTKNIRNKRAVADCIQEGLETIRDIKATARLFRIFFVPKASWIFLLPAVSATATGTTHSTARADVYKRQGFQSLFRRKGMRKSLIPFPGA